MHAYDVEAWHELFVMMGGATAALAGLVFVAVSLNLDEILAGAKLPNLAGRTLSVLITLLILCALGLAPQSTTALGIELTSIGLALVVFMTITSLNGEGPDDPAIWRIANVGLGLAASLPALVAGVSLLAEVGGGFYWLLAELVVGTAVAAYNGWILLIEIKR